MGQIRSITVCLKGPCRAETFRDPGQHFCSRNRNPSALQTSPRLTFPRMVRIPELDGERPVLHHGGSEHKISISDASRHVGAPMTLTKKQGHSIPFLLLPDFLSNTWEECQKNKHTWRCYSRSCFVLQVHTLCIRSMMWKRTSSLASLPWP